MAFGLISQWLQGLWGLSCVGAFRVWVSVLWADPFDVVRLPGLSVCTVSNFL